MIRLQDYTPEVYYRKSRDFQFIGRLYDLVLNYVKTNADLIYNVPFNDCSDDQLIELLSLTLGFKAKHSYVSTQLRAVCSVFTEILRNKGSIRALKIACAAIFKAEGINEEVEYVLEDNNTKLILYLPQELENLTLLNDLLEYVLPAGMLYVLVKEFRIKNDSSTKLGTKDNIEIFGNDSTIYKKWNFSTLIPKYDEKTDTAFAQAKDIEGILANSSVWKIENGD